MKRSHNILQFIYKTDTSINTLVFTQYIAPYNFTLQWNSFSDAIDLVAPCFNMFSTHESTMENASRAVNMHWTRIALFYPSNNPCINYSMRCYVSSTTILYQPHFFNYKLANDDRYSKCCSNDDLLHLTIQTAY